ncbi:MAG: PIN domain-containing protein [Thermoplasmata archaeon]|nr:PIN domain-containing protein [Thermoplasmata archaeon]
MKHYLFDTNAISLAFDNALPEKWVRPWKEVRMGNGRLLLFEPLVSETYYKNIPKYGKKASKDKIYWLKSLPKTKIHQIDDNDAINAGDIKVQYSRKLSLVDCFLLAVAKANSAKVFTTDPSVRDTARDMNINIDYLPLPKT